MKHKGNHHTPPSPKGRGNFRRIFAVLILLAVAGCHTKPTTPSARYGAKMIFDPVAKRGILFGGRTDRLFGLKYFDDLWAFDPQSQHWEEIETELRPAGRISPGMVYDPANHQIIVFGGGTKEDRAGDTWVYDVATNRWEEITPANSPSPRSDMGMVYDEAHQVVILFSGYCRGDFHSQCDDTWVFDPQTQTWTEMHPAEQPPIMYGHSLVYDSASEEVLLLGGNMLATPMAGYIETRWRYSYTESRWEEIEWVSANHPHPRYWQMATSTTNGHLFLFGGNGGNNFLNDTWLLDFGTGAGERIITQAAPSPRINAAIAYDPENELVILFGGFTEDRKSLQDTWVFTQEEWRNLQ